jgi:hypothetical protein
MVKRFEVPDLAVLKISYPRATPQGGTYERDMHGGQQYVRLLKTAVCTENLILVENRLT